MTFLKLFLMYTFKDPNLVVELQILAENLKKSWTPLSSWSSFFPGLLRGGWGAGEDVMIVEYTWSTREWMGVCCCGDLPWQDKEKDRVIFHLKNLLVEGENKSQEVNINNQSFSNITHLFISRSEQAPVSVFHPRDESGKLIVIFCNLFCAI